MAATEKLNVDFSKERIDLVTQGTGLALSQFSNSCMLGQFFLEESQELFDSILAMEEGRTLYAAKGNNLDALGRIVGEPRTAFQYSDLSYMWADRSAQGVDKIEV